jgi:hypothetical protein
MIIKYVHLITKGTVQNKYVLQNRRNRKNSGNRLHALDNLVRTISFANQAPHKKEPAVASSLHFLMLREACPVGVYLPTVNFTFF